MHAMLSQGVCCVLLLQAHKDLFHWGGRMSGLVQDLTSSMEATPPPAHSLGAHLLQAKYADGELAWYIFQYISIVHVQCAPAGLDDCCARATFKHGGEVTGQEGSCC
jgi:hypothetical protein